MERAVLYTRVSTQEQAQEGVSLAAQEEKLLAYCTLRGLAVVRVVREEGVSAAKPLHVRPGGSELLRLLSSHEAEHVVALKLDRLFRDAADALNQTRAWDRSGVALHLVDMGGQAIDTSSAMGRMFLTMMAGFAELERNLISERTAAALRHKKAHRQVYGPTPFGYRRKGEILVAEDKEQQTLSLVRSLRAQGLSLRAIARQLTAAGIPTKKGGRWAAQTVSLLLSNDLYTEEVA